MYEPLYSPTEGGPYGYRCKVRTMLDGTVSKNGALCNKVCRTYRGIVMHCKKVHGLEQQQEMFGDDDGEKTQQSSDELLDVRRAEADRSAAGGAGKPAGGKDFLSLFSER